MLLLEQITNAFVIKPTLVNLSWVLKRRYIKSFWIFEISKCANKENMLFNSNHLIDYLHLFWSTYSLYLTFCIHKFPENFDRLFIKIYVLFCLVFGITLHASAKSDQIIVIIKSNKKQKKRLLFFIKIRKIFLMFSLSILDISSNQIGVISFFDLICVLIGVSLHLLFSQSISFLGFISSGCLFVWLSSFPIWSKNWSFFIFEPFFLTFWPSLDKRF